MELEELLAKAVEKVLAAQQAELGVADMAKKAYVDAKFEQFKADITALISETVAKALPADREGVGRKGTVLTDEEVAAADPIAYLTKKAQAKPFDELAASERRAVAHLTIQALVAGMKE